MRLWTLHPKYLDARGLVALWREALPERKALEGRTRGCRNHPQLIRFQGCSDPLGAVAVYLRHVYVEARHRGYRFDITKIGRRRFAGKVLATGGQLAYELQHLRRKLFAPDRIRHRALATLRRAEPLPLFRSCRGGIAKWEVIT